MEEGISIIVPIYNTKITLLEECIKSIMSQTYNNIEVILINDGSTEGYIRDVLEDYAKKDTRIIAVNKDNSGVSSTRNLGVCMAKKKWIMFVDADDYLEMDACEELLNVCGIDTNIVISKNQVVNLKKEIVEINNNCNCNWTITSESEKKELIASIFRDGDTKYHYVDTPWAKLYNRKFLLDNEIRFKEDLKMAEDGLFNFEAFMKAKEIKYLHKPTYFYRKNDESVCHKCNYFIIDNYKKVFDYYEKLFKLIDIDFSDDYNYFIYRQIRNIIQRYFFNKKNVKSKKELKTEFKELYKYTSCENALKALKIKNLNNKNKVMYLIIKTESYFIEGIFFRLLRILKR